MKKRLFSLILLLFLVSCTQVNSTSSSYRTSTNDFSSSISSSIEEITEPCISLDKYTFLADEEIKIYTYNVSTNEYVAIFSLYDEPGKIGSPIKKKRIKEDSNEVIFKSSDFEAGDYRVFLYTPGYDDVIDVKCITIKDNDNSNYKINSASFNYDTNLLSINVSNNKLLTYEIYWANNKTRLTEYKKIKKISSTSSFDISFSKNIVMPNEANEIEIAVVEGQSESYFLSLNNKLKLNESKLLYEFQILTDIHIESQTTFKNYKSHFKTALTEIKNSSSSLGIFTIGDNTNSGSKANYKYMKEIISESLKNSDLNIYYAMGNHDYMYHETMESAIELFKSELNLSNHYYSLDLNDSKFIFLSSDTINSLGTMENNQLNWFKNEIASCDKSMPIFIFLHQPLDETIYGTLGDQQNSGFGNVKTQIKNTLSGYSNAFIFSGHSHYSLDCENIAAFSDTDVSYLHCGSLSQQFDETDTELSQAEGVYCYVYEDYIVFKGRDFLERKWIPHAYFVCPKK